MPNEVTEVRSEADCILNGQFCPNGECLHIIKSNENIEFEYDADFNTLKISFWCQKCDETFDNMKFVQKDD